MTVVKRAENNKWNRAQWYCWCDCEKDIPLENRNLIIVPAERLKNGQTTSCGCLHKENTSKARTIDLTGKTFGYLTVINRAGSTKSKGVLWNCRCICEKIKVIPSHYLTSGKVRSCGCKKGSLMRKNYQETFTTKEYVFEEDYVIGYTQNTNKPFFVDCDDYETIKNYKWNEKYDTNYIYGTSVVDGDYVYLHRLITKCPDDMLVDHINGNRFDNRKNNLRIVNHLQNAMNTSLRKNNTSGIKGVSYNKKRNKWYSYITYNHKTISLGLYDTKEEAQIARQKAEEKYQGEYSYNNSRR